MGLPRAEDFVRCTARAQLDRLHAVVKASGIDIAGIEDKYGALRLMLEGLELPVESSTRIWYTLDNITAVNLGLSFVVDSLDWYVMSIARPIPLGICSEENLTLLEDGGVQCLDINYRSKEELQGYAETLEEYGDFDAVQRHDAWAIKLLADHALEDLAGAVEARETTRKDLQEESQEFELEAESYSPRAAGSFSPDSV